MKIAEAVAKGPPGKYEPGMTSAQWLVRRIRAKRVAHYNVCSDTISGSSELLGRSANNCFQDQGSEKDRRGTGDTIIPAATYA